MTYEDYTIKVDKQIINTILIIIMMKTIIIPQNSLRAAAALLSQNSLRAAAALLLAIFSQQALPPVPMKTIL